MPVPQLLATHTSQELSEWRAFELLHGFADRWIIDALGDLHEQIQFTNHLLGGAHFTEKDDDNPIPAPRRYPRPGELRKPFSFESEAEDNEED